MDLYSEWKGRLVVKWPVGRLWWRWAKTNDFPILTIHEDSQLDAEMPSWDRLSLTWQDLRVLPTKWKSALRQWRGIYYIFDVKVGKGCVGSACGQENILGRWLGYAASGHGGNKKLKTSLAATPTARRRRPRIVELSSIGSKQVFHRTSFAPLVFLQSLAGQLSQSISLSGEAFPPGLLIGKRIQDLGRDGVLFIRRQRTDFFQRLFEHRRHIHSHGGKPTFGY